MLIILLPAFFATLVFSARNYGGEVATLYTTDADGRTFQTPLWLVEDGGGLWVRAVRPDRAWLERVVERPDVELERRSRLQHYRAVPMPEQRERINTAMARRYGWAEWLLGLVDERGDAVPVRLSRF